MDTWEQTVVLSGHRGLVLALACFGDRLISGSDDRCIRVWRMGSWECERILTGHNGGIVGVCCLGGARAAALPPPPPCGAECAPRSDGPVTRAAYAYASLADHMPTLSRVAQAT